MTNLRKPPLEKLTFFTKDAFGWNKKRNAESFFQAVKSLASNVKSDEARKLAAAIQNESFDIHSEEFDKQVETNSAIFSKIADLLDDGDYSSALLDVSEAGYPNSLPGYWMGKLYDRAYSFLKKYGGADDFMIRAHEAFTTRGFEPWVNFGASSLFVAYARMARDSSKLPASELEVLELVMAMPHSAKLDPIKIQCAFSLSDSPEKAYSFVMKNLGGAIRDQHCLLALKNECQKHDSVKGRFFDDFESGSTESSLSETACLTSSFFAKKISLKFSLKPSNSAALAKLLAEAEKNAMFKIKPRGFVSTISNPHDEHGNLYFFSDRKSLEFSRSVLNAFHADLDYEAAANAAKDSDSADFETCRNFLMDSLSVRFEAAALAEALNEKNESPGPKRNKI